MTDDGAPLTVSVPTEDLRAALADLPGVEVLSWTMTDPPPRDTIDLVVVPYMSKPDLLGALAGVRTRLVQSQSIGYDGVAGVLPPGHRFANAAGVHEASTAELAIGLMISAQRQLPRYARDQGEGVWRPSRSRALADSRVVVLGQGGVGRAINARLAPFEVDLVRAATTRRTDEAGTVYGLADLPDLLGGADIVVLAVPLTPDTTGMVDATFLDRMKPDALLVNVARGAVVVTADLVAAVAGGRIRAALDVVDPEPLPPDHPLWTLDGVFLTPHVGGNSAAMAPRVAALVRRQAAALRAGEPPINVVIAPRTLQ